MKYEEKALTTAANSGAELVRTYDTVITETVNNQVVALKLFQQVQGRGQVRIKVRTGRNPAVGSYAESDPIVTGQATRVEIGIYWKLYKAPVEVTGLMIEEAKASGVRQRSKHGCEGSGSHVGKWPFSQLNIFCVAHSARIHR